ncbi:MAG: tRNA (adenosine(37)-N6)-threonylcarbamoyltransferase complex dimerization subunit type 1 TsaB [Oligoflexia bacterium]|nr:tRNA (adenosine(37)-N6)-threonylcarbamoyltransferase complex dimerization subunit type 1 TsaB [Oligoflexia bacterium]
MKLLAWDTSSKVGALAAIEWDPSSKEGWAGVRLVSEWTLNVDATHSERLMWAIHHLLESARWKLDEVDLFGVGVGPGSFTGLRIGVTTARTLAHTLKKPLLGVSSLAALARPLALSLGRSRAGSEALARTVVVACTDACKGELFSLVGSARAIGDCVTMAEGDEPGLWKRGVSEEVLSPGDLVQLVKKKLAQGKRDAHWTVVGDGRNRYVESWKCLPAAKELKVSQPFPNHVQGRYVALLAWEASQAGLARHALKVHPRYLRASDAELKLKAGLLPPGPSRFGTS